MFSQSYIFNFCIYFKCFFPLVVSFPFLSGLRFVVVGFSFFNQRVR